MFLVHAVFVVSFTSTTTIYLIIYSIFVFDEHTDANTQVRILYIGGYAVLLTDFIAQMTCVFIFASFGKKAVPHESVETEVSASESDREGPPELFFSDGDKVKIKKQSWTSSEDINADDMADSRGSSFQSSALSEVTDTGSSRIWEQFIGL